MLMSLRKGAYTSSTAVATDVALIAANCRRYHPPTSPIVRRVEQLMAVFASTWRSSGLPLPLGAGFPSEATLREMEEGGGLGGGEGVPTDDAAAMAQPRRPPRHSAGQYQRMVGGGGRVAAVGRGGYSSDEEARRAPAAAAGGGCSSGPLPAHESWQPLAVNIIRAVLRDSRASVFSEPVNVNELPGYTKVRRVGSGIVCRG